MIGKKYFLLGIGTFLTVLTVAHVLIFRNLSPHVVLEELYYIPIFLAALRFGLMGAMLTYLFASVLYMPFFFGQWSPTYLDVIDRSLHLFFSALFAFLAGYLIERERRTEKQAEQDRSLRGIGQAATAIVHDLKNPLITILGYAKRIQEQKGEPQEAARIIYESAESMQRIVHDVLDFAKPLQPTCEEEDLRHVIRLAVDFCTTKAEEAGVTLKADLPDRSVRLAVDRTQMQRALVNLISNAVEASEKGQSVTVSLVPGTDSLNIFIRDEGAGMDRETLGAVFKPFYTRKNGGTGLGMSISRKIVEGHKGRISVRSRPGRGTTVAVELPCEKAAGSKREE